MEFGELHTVPEGRLRGKRWRWEDFQLAFLEKLFGAPNHVARGILSIGRRGGKTGTMAMLGNAALYGPLAVAGSLIITASRSIKQASIVYSYSRKMAILSGFAGQLVIRESTRELLQPSLDIRLQAVSADAEKAVGFGPRMVIHDELGEVRGPRDTLYENLSTGLGTYDDSIEVIASTQAEADGDLLSLLIDDALSEDNRDSIVELHAAPMEADPWVESTWRLAQPSLGTIRSLDDMARKARDAQRLPSLENSFRNRMLNQRVSTDTPWMSAALWAHNATPPDLELFKGQPCYGGLDLSAREDLTSLVLACDDAEGFTHVLCWAWTPLDTLTQRAARDRTPYDIWVRDGHLIATPGSSIAMRWVAREVGAIVERFNVQTIHYDPWRIDVLEQAVEAANEEDALRAELDGTELLAEIALPLVKCVQGYKTMTPAIEEVEHAAIEHLLRHGGNPVLSAAVTRAVVVTDPAENKKLDKSKSTTRIDPAVALAMAMRGLKVDAEAPSYTSTHGLITLARS